MGLAGFGRKLRLKQGRNEKPVCWRFNGTNLALRSSSDDGKSRFDDRPYKLGIQFKIAEELFGDYIFLVKRMKIRSRTDADLGNLPREFGRICLPVRNRAGDGRNHNVL